MKLIVRSQYWGRILKGKLRRNFDFPNKPYRVITCQAVTTNEGQYWGCCPHHGKRVLELKEDHFNDHHSHDWDLYMVGSSVSPTYSVHSFFLLPQNQTFIDITSQMSCNGWSYVGTISASVARMDLQELVFDLLKQNEDYGFRYHHIHLEILMDQIFDRETPRTRKAANEKNRVDRGSSFKPNTNKNSHKIPPIPHVVSNDASWATETTQASSVTNSMCHETWNDSFPSMMEQPVHFYPAAMPHPHHHPGAAQQHLHQMGPPSGMSAVHQVLRGYPMGPIMPALPLGYAPFPFYGGASQHPEWMMMPHPEFAETMPVPYVEGYHPGYHHP